MNRVKFYWFLLLFGFCSTLSYAGPYDVVISGPVQFVQKPQKPFNVPDISIRPFSLTSSPDGYIWGTHLTINLNTASIYTTIKIDKTGEGIVHSEHLSHNEEKVVDYDLSLYGSGEYTVTITFYNAETYEAVIIIE